MGVGIGHQGDSVQRTQPPVHRRVGRETGFDGEDPIRIHVEGLLERIKARLRTEDGKPRGPGMGGDDDGVGRDVEDDPAELFYRKTEGGAPIGHELPPGGEGGVEPPGRLQRWRIEKGMDLPQPPPLVVDVRDLDLEDEADALTLLLQSIQAGFCRCQLGLEFNKVGGMREVSGPKEGNTLSPRPPSQRLHFHLAAGRPTVPGVQMQGSDKGHRPPTTTPGQSLRYILHLPPAVNIIAFSALGRRESGEGTARSAETSWEGRGVWPGARGLSGPDGRKDSLVPFQLFSANIEVCDARPVPRLKRALPVFGATRWNGTR